jgi:hypothetical protein
MPLKEGVAAKTQRGSFPQRRNFFDIVITYS